MADRRWRLATRILNSSVLYERGGRTKLRNRSFILGLRKRGELEIFIKWFCRPRSSLQKKNATGIFRQFVTMMLAVGLMRTPDAFSFHWNFRWMKFCYWIVHIHQGRIRIRQLYFSPPITEVGTCGNWGGVSFIRNMQSGNERLSCHLSRICSLGMKGYYVIYPACAIGFVSKAGKEDLWRLGKMHFEKLLVLLYKACSITCV